MGRYELLTVNYILITFIVAYLLQLLSSLCLEIINNRYLKEKGDQVPLAFKDIINKAKLSQIISYNIDNSRLGQLQLIISELLVLGIILCGLLPALDFFSAGGKSNYIIAGDLFFLTLGLITSLLNLPFSYYHTFFVEEKYGFNQSTLKIWITDNLKSGIISVVLLFLLLSPVLWFIRRSPTWWWFWAFMVVSMVQVLLTILYPVLIAPLFNKFEPLKDESLAQKVTQLMEKAGIKIKDILQMDASKRSRHTNAYFTGLGKSKRIVFFDTLINSHSHEEILSVLAHEAGHFKKKHIIKQLLLFEATMLVGFYLTYKMLNWHQIPLTFGFEPYQTHISLFLVALFWEKAGYYLKPLYMAISRHFEYQADLFSINLLGTGKPMIAGLKRMAADNLSNLNPHPLYVWFNFSHPPLVKRISFLENTE